MNNSMIYIRKVFQGFQERKEAFKPQGKIYKNENIQMK